MIIAGCSSPVEINPAPLAGWWYGTIDRNDGFNRSHKITWVLTQEGRDVWGNGQWSQYLPDGRTFTSEIFIHGFLFDGEVGLTVGTKWGNTTMRGPMNEESGLLTWGEDYVFNFTRTENEQ